MRHVPARTTLFAGVFVAATLRTACTSAVQSGPEGDDEGFNYSAGTAADSPKVEALTT